MRQDRTGWQSFTTSSIPREERLASWQDSTNDLFPSKIIDGAPADEFHGSLGWMRFGEVVLADFTSIAMEVSRAEEQVVHTDQSCEVCFQVEGTCHLAQGGRSHQAGPRDIVLYDSRQPHRMVFDGPYRQIVLKVPRRLLRDRVPGLDAMLVQPIPGEALPGRFLFDFVLSLCEVKGDLARDSLVSRLEGHVLELLVTTLSEVAQDRPGGIALSAGRQAQLARVKAYILTHLDDPTLSPAGIARAQSISLRTLYELFEGEELQVSRWIKAQRLERIRRDLGDSLLAAWPITTIALRRGFKDFSHFSRAFRAQYGISPRAYRQSRAS